METNILKAFMYAKTKHEGQIRAGTTDLPYFTHCENVYNLVTNFLIKYNNGSKLNEEKLQILALLHDTIEDTDATYEEISSLFGQEIADGILALTKDSSLPKNMKLKDSLERIKKQPPEVSIVKMCDRIDNISKINPSWDYSRSCKYLEESKQILLALGDNNSSIKEQLSIAIKNYEKIIYNHFKEQESINE